MNRHILKASKEGRPGITTNLFLALLFAGGLIGGLASQLKKLPGTAEVQIGMVIVIALTALMVLLLVMAVAFETIGLADRRQAIGLPRGSVRAMIALFLLLVFVIFGIYLFRTVAEDRGSPGTLRGLTLPEVEALNLEASNQRVIGLAKDYNEDNRFLGTYTVSVRGPISESGKQMGLQIVTVLGTLATAVAAFYFGTSSVQAAREAVEARSEPLIRSIDPPDGEENKELSLRVLGKNFKSPRSVKLVRGPDQMVASDILSSATALTCKLKIDKPAGGEKWDVVVENEDGGQDKLEKAFEIRALEAEPPAEGRPASGNFKL